LRAHAHLAVKPDIVVVHADVGHVLGLLRDGDILGLARYLAGFVERLGAAGATLAVVAAVTPHICAPALQGLSALPLVSIVDAIRDALKQSGLNRIALFGTRFVIETDLFGGLTDLDVVRPHGDASCPAWPGIQERKRRRLARLARMAGSGPAMTN
jgi:aspartate racemase